MNEILFKGKQHEETCEHFGIPKEDREKWETGMGFIEHNPNPKRYIWRGGEMVEILEEEKK